MEGTTLYMWSKVSRQIDDKKFEIKDMNQVATRMRPQSGNVDVAKSEDVLALKPDT